MHISVHILHSTNRPIIAVDVVMDIPLRSSERAHRPAISYDYTVYLQEHEYDVGDVSYPTTYKYC